MPTAVVNGVNGANGVAAEDFSRKTQAAEPQKRKTLPDIDPSKLTITLCEKRAAIPAPEALVFGTTATDHMLMITFNPESGWSAPSIQPFGPISLDPRASCLQYASNVFEGMKAFIGPDGKPRLFRPEMNMARMKRSADRVALPPFDELALLTLIKRLVVVEQRWIPNAPGCSLYIRPTVIGTRPSLGVSASTHAMIYVVLSPTGPYFPGPVRPISLYANSENPRAWPGGTGEFKLALNYAPTFKPQREAAQHGYDQILWLFGPDQHLGEVGQMNVFAVLQRDDGAGFDLITPPLDGMILPGVTRASMIELATRHGPKYTLPGLAPDVRLNVVERHMPLAELLEHHASGKLKEFFGVGTAAILVPAHRIGYADHKQIRLDVPTEGFGPVAKALREEIMAIQEAWKLHEWSVLCE